MITNEQFKKHFEETVAPKLPEFIKAVEEAKKNDAFLLIHQDSFGADYHGDGLLEMARAVKYAGLFGVGVTIIGANGDTKKPVTQIKANTNKEQKCVVWMK